MGIVYKRARNNSSYGKRKYSILIVHFRNFHTCLKTTVDINNCALNAITKDKDIIFSKNVNQTISNYSLFYNSFLLMFPRID